MNRAVFALVLLGGCSLVQSASEQYYAGKWDPPSVDGLSIPSESGNVGGGETVIQGSGFGEDPNEVVVQFGDENAEILAISDSSITVRVPPGPITGGAVPIRVATETGFYPPDGDASPVSYTYDVGAVYDQQIGFVQVNNFWESCYGGLSDRGDHATAGCDQIAYIGLAGIDGTAEALKFQYPRLHTEDIGFMGGTDMGDAEWKFERPGQLAYAAAVDDLHQDIGPITLTNDLWDGVKFCADLDGLASYRYGGGEVTGQLGDDGYLSRRTPYTINDLSIADGELVDEDEACREGRAEFPVDEMPFCASTDAEGVPDYVYQPQWPIAANFFEGADELTPVTVKMTAEKVGINQQELSLPESLVAYAEEGFPAGSDDLWSLTEVEGCFDGDDDRNGEDLDDVALSFAWKPAEFTPTEGLESNTFVRVTFTALALNWFGTTSFPVRATIVVPDEYNYEKRDDFGERGKFSHLDIPAEVLYQFPTVRLPSSGGFGGGSLLDSSVGDWGYVIATFERVTEYSIPSDAGGHVVFSYTTGDFGFFGWTNPTEADGCHNCIDDDEDGWADEDDPDCDGGTEEVGFGETACNDGRDNDGDGDEDVDDELCASATDDDESNCDDRVDNDGDGLRDEDDPECADGSGRNNESEVLTLCLNGEDDDGDGWSDADDPDCAVGDDETGYGQAECNDGADNDGDGLTDAEDSDCLLATSNESATVSACADGLDNDADGWTDVLDPDCASGSDELGFGSDECNDGLDNDGDGGIDALDTECTSAAGTEAAALTGCANGTDDDADGWTDASDPDCASGTDEVGFGSAECNDGADNDGDGATDALDAECLTADGTEAAASVSTCADGLDDDLDGWIDSDDPDCASGTTEAGFGSTQCNDGVDNDGDLAFDALDPECAAASDDDEGA